MNLYRFTSITECNLPLMRKLKFNYGLSDLNMVEYKNVSIGAIWNDDLKQFCHDNKHSIEILKLDHVFMEPAVQILAILSNITHLTLDTRTLNYYKNFDIKDYHPIELPNLKYLNSFSPILKVICKHQVQELVVQANIFDGYKISKLEAESVRKFLTFSPNLTALTVFGTIEFYRSTYSFKLKTLICTANRMTQIFPRNGYSNFKGFLLSQKDSLKELTIDFMLLTQKNFILNEMKLSKFHDLSYSLLLDYEEEIVPSTTIKDLKIHGGARAESIDYFQMIVNNCPLVEKLDLLQFHGLSHEMIPQLAELNHLRELKLRIPILVPHDVISLDGFKHLQHLQVAIELEGSCKEISMNLLDAIIHCCTSLKFLHVKNDMRFTRYYSDVPIDLKKLLMPLKMLEELHLDGFVLENYQFIFETCIRKVKIFTKTLFVHAHLPEIFNATKVRFSLINV